MSNADLSGISFRGNIAKLLLEGGSTNLDTKLLGYILDDADLGIVYQFDPYIFLVF